MKLFEENELKDAIDHAREGGQALHLFNWFQDPNAPACFNRATAQGKPLGHLFDQDATRLDATAARLGVRKRVISRYGTPMQHIDLCGRPLERAVAEAEMVGVG